MGVIAFTRLARVVLLSASVMLCAGLVSVGFGQGTSALIGLWVPVGGVSAPRGFPDNLQLREDGTFLAEGLGGSWRVVGGRLVLRNELMNFAYNYDVSGSALALVDENGRRASYNKHQSGDKPLPTKEELERATLMNNVNALMQKDVDAKIELGFKQLESKNYAAAIETFNYLVKTVPKHPAGYTGLGVAYRMSKDYDKALANFNQAMQIVPNDGDLYYERGRVYGRMKSYDRAIADYSQALKLKPSDNEDVYNNRGYAYLEKGDHAKALADFDQAVRLYPKSANAYDSRGEAYLTIGEYDKAIADYSQALRLDPNMDSAKEGLAEAKKKKGGR